MKKVWILERFITKEEMSESLQDIINMRDTAEDVKLQSTYEEWVKSYVKKMEDHPEGYWLGSVGKSAYKDFCWEAKESLRYWKGKNKNFRVVEGEIKDTDKYWTNYTPVKINSGVMKYLFATLQGRCK